MSNVPQSEKLLFSIKEVAEILGIGRTTVYRLVENGELKSAKIGSRRVFTRGHLEQFCERLESESSDL